MNNEIDLTPKRIDLVAHKAQMKLQRLPDVTTVGTKSDRLKLIKTLPTDLTETELLIIIAPGTSAYPDMESFASRLGLSRGNLYVYISNIKKRYPELAEMIKSQNQYRKTTNQTKYQRVLSRVDSFLANAGAVDTANEDDSWFNDIVSTNS